MREINPLLKTESAYRALDEKEFKAELELFDRFQSFSAELLRLSLGGIAVVGFLFEKAAKINGQVRWSIFCFALGVLFALCYRYTLTEGLRFYLEGLRCEPRSEKSLQSRHKWLSFCMVCKIASAVSLATGAALLAFGFFHINKVEATRWDKNGHVVEQLLPK